MLETQNPKKNSWNHFSKDLFISTSVHIAFLLQCSGFSYFRLIRNAFGVNPISRKQGVVLVSGEVVRVGGLVLALTQAAVSHYCQ